MSTRVTVAGHPIHPMLVTIPIALWVFSVLSDFVFVFTDDSRWAVTAWFTLGGGIVGALIAAVPGLLDLLGLHDQTVYGGALGGLAQLHLTASS